MGGGIDFGILFTRPYWLDEWHAVLVANRATPVEVLSDLRQGSDFAPPLLHLVLWLLRILSGGTLEPWLARSFAVGCTAGALAFAYLILRRRFDRMPSIAGALAIATHGIVVAYAFEARFYAPWLLFAAAFAWSLSVDATRPASRRRDVAVALAAIGLCTVHWFGVVTLLLMCAGGGAALALGRDWRAAARRLAPAAAGVVALIVCLPLLFGQRGAIIEKSWIAELSGPQLRELVMTFWAALPPLLALTALAVAFTLTRTRPRSTETTAVALRDPSIAALLALAAMPLVLTVISLRQPAMLPRYAIAAVLAWAPLIALATQLASRAIRVAVVVLVAVGALLGVGGQLGVQRQVLRATTADRLLLREACRDGAVAFTTRVQMYYHTDEIQARCPRAGILLLPDSTLARLFGRNSVTYRIENEFARLHQRLYGFPRVIVPAELDSLAHFVVMSDPVYLPRDAQGRELFSRGVFPRHDVTPLNGDGALYQRAR